MIPVSYFWLIPYMVQKQIENVAADSLALEGIKVTNMTADTIDFSIKAFVKPMMPIPMRVGTGGFTIRIHDPENQVITRLGVPPMSFVISQGMSLDFSERINFAGANGAALSKMIKGLSSDEGLKDYKLTARFEVPVYVIGIRVYSGLPLYRGVALTGKADLKELLTGMPDIAKLPIDRCK